MGKVLKKRAKASRNGRRSRTKGHSFERELAILLRPLFPNARRHLEYQDQEANGVDLVETGDFRFQSKKCKAYVSINTINEITADRLLGEVPVLVTAADHKPAMAVLYFDDLLALMGQALESRS
jgi:hypothetical protein